MLTLLICDHPTLARGLEHQIRRFAELRVVGIAFDGEEAVRLARELSPDVVLMEIYLPKLDGISATRQIRRTPRAPRILLFTNSDQVGDLSQALAAGASGYIMKTQDLNGIVGAVLSVAAGNLIIPEDLAERVTYRSAVARSPELTIEEGAILDAIGQLKSNKQMASEFHLSDRTLRRRIQYLYSKLRLANRVAAVLFARGRGKDPRSDA